MDFLQFASKTFNKPIIPLWLFCIVVVPLFLVKLTPLFDFFYKVYQDSKKTKRESYKEAEPKMNNLKEKQESFFICLINLKNKIDKNSVNKNDIQQFNSKFDDLLGDLMFLCDGVKSGYVAKNTHLSNTINSILKHKHDKKDNMIVDVYNCLKKAYSKIGIDFREPLRIKTYDILFSTYRANFSIWTRFRGFFSDKVFNIN